MFYHRPPSPQSQSCFGCLLVVRGTRRQFTRHVKSCELAQDRLRQDERELAAAAAEEAKPDEDEGFFADHGGDASSSDDEVVQGCKDEGCKDEHDSSLELSSSPEKQAADTTLE